MSQFELLKIVVRHLEELNIDYMLTGSFVSSIQGQPRSSHDIDIKVQILDTEVLGLVEKFPANNYYLDADSAVEAVRNRKEQGRFI